MAPNEQTEREALAKKITAERDNNLIAHAKHEFEAMGYYGNEMNRMMADGVIDLLRTFSTQGHSGFSAGFARSIFHKLANYEPLGPLTGDDSEWFDHGHGGRFRYQNKRCGHVFKDENGIAYDINAVVFEEPNGCRFTGKYSCITVTFPYSPRSVTAKISSDATDEDKERAALTAWSAAA